MPKISQLPQDTAPTTDDYAVSLDSGSTTTKKSLWSDIISMVFNNVPSSSGLSTGWSTLNSTINTVTANGNRSYSCVINNQDVTGTLSPGMRLRTTRTIAAPTQCTSLNGTTQFYSKTSPAGMTFTNNFVVSGWVKLSSYTGSFTAIASRWNGTSGWRLGVGGNGQAELNATNGGSGNSFDVVSYQSIPLNKWVHIAIQMDMTSTTNSPTVNYVIIDGVDVPAIATRTGTNPTALVQAGNLEIGSQNAGASPFPGKIDQVAIYSAKVTQANILATMSQGLVGTETSLISAYSFNNSIADLNANANNLTANGGAVATNSDSPFTQQANGTPNGTQDYAIITKVAFSTNTTVTVQVPEGCTIPTTGGVSAVSYASVKAPYGMPVQRGKWTVVALYRTNGTQTIANTTTWYNLGNTQMNVPIGEWVLSYDVTLLYSGTSGSNQMGSTFSTQSSAEDNTIWRSVINSVSTSQMQALGHKQNSVSQVSQGIWYLLGRGFISVAALTIQFQAADADTVLQAECAYL